jgi:4-hydroxybenzoyl-CoA reductase subunit beta
MKSAKFEYRKANDVSEAIRLYQDFQGEAIYLSGGTDLIPRIKLGLEKPRALIDLKRIASLTTIDDQGEWFRIGSLAQISRLKRNRFVEECFPALKASLEATSCESLQMRATIGGNLLQNSRCLFYNQSEFWRKSKDACFKAGGEGCNVIPGAKACFANYCSDNAPALCTLSCRVELSGPDGERNLALDEIYSNKPEKPFNLLAGEILTAILIPKRKTVGGYEKLRLRGAIDYPLLGIAFSFFEGVGKLAVGAIGPKPYVQEMQKLGPETLEPIVKQVKPVGNTVLDPNYRKRMIPVLAERIVKNVMKGVQQ